jgi:hypothetical protein
MLQMLLLPLVLLPARRGGCGPVEGIKRGFVPTGSPARVQYWHYLYLDHLHWCRRWCRTFYLSLLVSIGVVAGEFSFMYYPYRHSHPYLGRLHWCRRWRQLRYRWLRRHHRTRYSFCAKENGLPKVVTSVKVVVPVVVHLCAAGVPRLNDRPCERGFSTSCIQRRGTGRRRYRKHRSRTHSPNLHPHPHRPMGPKMTERSGTAAEVNDGSGKSHLSVL